MTRAILLGVVASLFAAPAFAGNCGPVPSTPTHFDPASAQKSDILALKSKFEAYKTANTEFIECMKRGVTTSSDQRKIDETIEAEQAFAKAFNNNAKAWAKAQAQRGR